MICPFLCQLLFLLVLVVNTTSSSTFEHQKSEEKTINAAQLSERKSPGFEYFYLSELADLNIPQDKLANLKGAVENINNDVSSLRLTLPAKQRLGRSFEEYVKTTCDLELALFLPDYEKVFVPQAVLNHFLSERLSPELWSKLRKTGSFVRSLHDVDNQRSLIFLSKVQEIYAGYFQGEIMILPPASLEIEEFSLAMMSYAFIVHYLKLIEASPEIDPNQIVFGSKESIMDPQELIRTLKSLAEEYLDQSASVVKSKLRELGIDILKEDIFKRIGGAKLEEEKLRVFSRDSLDAAESPLKERLEILAVDVFSKHHQVEERKGEEKRITIYLYVDIPTTAFLEPRSLKNVRTDLEGLINDINLFLNNLSVSEAERSQIK